jgi:hypothetical protein
MRYEVRRTISGDTLDLKITTIAEKVRRTFSFLLE